MRSIQYHIFLTVLCLALFFAGLGSTPLWDIDETSNARAAVEMAERGDLVVPTLNGELRTDKPPLHYWLMMASFSVFGQNEFAARFFAGLFGLLTVLLVAEVGNRILGTTGGFVSGLVLAVSFLFTVSSRSATTDAFLVFFTNLAVLSAFFAPRKPIMGVISWASMGFAVLAKGPAGIVLPLGALVVFCLLDRSGEFTLMRLFNPVGILIFLAIAVPWYVIASARTGGDLVAGFFMKHNVARFLKPMESHSGPIYYYVLVLLAGFFPWAGFLPQGFRSTLRLKRAAGAHAGFGVLLITWALTVILFFTAARTKLPTYILPVFPALSLMIGALASSLEGSRTGRNRGLSASWFSAFLPAVFYPAVIFYLFNARVPELSPYFLAGIPMLLAPIMGTVLYLRGTPVRAFKWAAYGAAIGVLGIHLVAAPALEGARMAPAAGKAVAQAASTGDAMAVYGYFRPGVLFYAGRNSVWIGSETDLAEFVDRPDGRFLVALEEKYSALPGTLKNRFRILERGLDAADSNKVIVVAERIDGV